MNPLDTAGGAREMEAVLEQKGKRSVTFTQKKKPKKKQQQQQHETNQR